MRCSLLLHVTNPYSERRCTKLEGSRHGPGNRPWHGQLHRARLPPLGELVGIRSLRIWDTDPAALDKFGRNAASLGFNIHRAASAKDAVTGADIVTTCTADKSLATVLTEDMITVGIHINAIGGDCPGKTELDAAILHRANVLSSLKIRPESRARFNSFIPNIQ